MQLKLYFDSLFKNLCFENAEDAQHQHVKMHKHVYFPQKNCQGFTKPEKSL